MCKKAIDALRAELKIMQNIVKTSPDAYIVVVDDRMLRGAYDRDHKSIIRFHETINPDRGPFSPIYADADTVTTHNFPDATRFVNLIGAGAQGHAVNGPVMRSYIANLKASIKLLSDFDFSLEKRHD